jgi:hypothetical protein
MGIGVKDLGSGMVAFAEWKKFVKAMKSDSDRSWCVPSRRSTVHRFLTRLESRKRSTSETA